MKGFFTALSVFVAAAAATSAAFFATFVASFAASTNRSTRPVTAALHAAVIPLTILLHGPSKPTLAHFEMGQGAQSFFEKSEHCTSRRPTMLFVVVSASASAWKTDIVQGG